MRPMQALLFVGVVVGANHSVMHAEADVNGGVKTAKPPKTEKRDKRAIDPKADALLMAMSTQLSSMKSFSFESEQVLEVVTKEGEKIQGLVETKVAIERPNKLRVDRMGPFGGGSIYYDGKTVTFYGKRENLYASAEAPGTLDETIDFTREALSIDAPGADLIHDNPYAVLMEDVVSGRYLGEEMVGDRKCHHVAYRGNEVDWQLWIADGAQALPCRMVITSKKVTGSPEFTVVTSKWKEGKHDASSFVFTPPKDAVKIKFVTVSDKAETRKTQARRK